LLSFLRQNNVPFLLRHHPPAISATDLAASEHVPTDMVAKSIAFAAHGRYVLAVVPATCHVDLDRLRGATNEDDLHIVGEPELALVFPDCELGALHPFGNLYRVPVYVDSTLANARSFAFHAGTHRDAIYVSYADFVRVVQPVISDIRLEPL
jgi:Ala-tRNA(Pro) deacylase